MDIYDWKQINSKVCVIPVKKKFYGKYYAKTQYYCPGAYLIRLAELNNNHNFLIGWHRRRSVYSSRDRDVWQLYNFFQSKKKFSWLKIRIEEPYINLYAEDPESLYSLAKSDFVDYRHRLEEIHIADSSRKLLLDSSDNVLILENRTEYNYKITFRTGCYRNLQSIYSYLIGLEDSVLISNSVKRKFIANSSFLSNGWIYAKDSSVVTFLQLIEPRLISNIFKLEYTSS